MSQFISLQEGIDMTATYRAERSDLIAKGAITADLLPICETFEKSQVITLLNKTDCEGLRIYLGVEESKIKLILVGVNSQDEDMITTGNTRFSVSQEEDGDDDELLERGIRCPTTCPPASDLNP